LADKKHKNGERIALRVLLNGKLSFRTCKLSRYCLHHVRWCCGLKVIRQGRSDGGISVYILPKSVTVLFTCGTLTHVLKLQWLVKKYTPPNQIPGYATGFSILCFIVLWSVPPTSRLKKPDSSD